jgi:hypothetical protein
MLVHIMHRPQTTPQQQQHRYRQQQQQQTKASLLPTHNPTHNPTNASPHNRKLKGVVAHLQN